MTRPGRWETVQTDAGWHLRLVGANGEIVLSSEVYTRKEAADAALELARRSSDDPGEQ